MPVNNWELATLQASYLTAKNKNMENKLIGVSAAFHYQDKNGKHYTCEADFNNESWNQWGASREQLSDNVVVLEAVEQALSEFMRVADDE